MIQIAHRLLLWSYCPDLGTPSVSKCHAKGMGPGTGGAVFLSLASSDVFHYRIVPGAPSLPQYLLRTLNGVRGPSCRGLAVTGRPAYPCPLRSAFKGALT